MNCWHQSYIRTCISITMKFINEVVNGGITIILFMVRSLAQEEEVDPYHLDLVLISLFF